MDRASFEYPNIVISGNVLWRFVIAKDLHGKHSAIAGTQHTSLFCSDFPNTGDKFLLLHFDCTAAGELTDGQVRASDESRNHAAAKMITTGYISST
jgi:hypothetical protein